MSEYKEKKIHRTIRLPNFYEKIDLLDSLTHGGVRGRGCRKIIKLDDFAILSLYI